jgi:hypothetical protein
MVDIKVIIMNSLPFWMPRKKNVIWYLLFILLFLLSLDYWQWNMHNPLIYGLPIWVIYFIILTLFTSISFYIFTKFYWRDNSD